MPKLETKLKKTTWYIYIEFWPLTLHCSVREKSSLQDIVRCLFRHSGRTQYKCKYKYRIKTSKNNKRKEGRNRQHRILGVDGCPLHSGFC